MSKPPAFQFYPEDWLSNIKLQLCPMDAQGLLINLMCLMHQSERYGYLLINGDRPTNKEMIDLLRMHHRSFYKALSILLKRGVIKEDEDGTLYCRRMVDDNRLREIRKAAGSRGGNPILVNQAVNQAVNQKPTPSSSSSTSTNNPPNPPARGERSHSKNWRRKNNTVPSTPPPPKPVYDIEAYRAACCKKLKKANESFREHVCEPLRDELNSWEWTIKPLFVVEVTKDKATLYHPVPATVEAIGKRIEEYTHRPVEFTNHIPDEYKTEV